MIDESHATIPQIGGMYEGDKSRKTVLVEHGFRLPSALDNRPLRFDEFMQMTGQRVYVSATPGPFEIVNSRPENKRFIPVQARREGGVADDLDSKLARQAERQRRAGRGLRRPTKRGTAADRRADHPPDRPARSGASRCARSRGRSTRRSNSAASGSRSGERVLVTTLTKKTAEDLSEYLQGRRAEGALHPRRHRRGRAGGDPAPAARRGLRHPGRASTCCARASTCRRSRWSASSTPTRRASCATRPSLIQTAGRAARHITRRVRAVLRRGDRLDPAPARRDRVPPRAPAGTQRATRDHAAGREAGGAGKPAHVLESARTRRTS